MYESFYFVVGFDDRIIVMKYNIEFKEFCIRKVSICFFIEGICVYICILNNLIVCICFFLIGIVREYICLNFIF